MGHSDESEQALTLRRDLTDDLTVDDDPSRPHPLDEHPHGLEPSHAGRGEDGSVNIDLARRLQECSHLTGSFVLRSGATSTEYFDKFQFTARPDLLRDVAKELAHLLPSDVEVVAGIQLGGVPLAAALSLETGLPAVYVRLERKEYATKKIAEGVDIAGKTVAVIEDVVSTGGQIVLSAADLREEGAIVPYALAVVDRSADGAPALAAAGLEYRTVFSATDLVSA